MTGSPVQVVWFKRDLRITDHEPLAEAAGSLPRRCGWTASDGNADKPQNGQTEVHNPGCQGWGIRNAG